MKVCVTHSINKCLHHEVWKADDDVDSHFKTE